MDSQSSASNREAKLAQFARSVEPILQELRANGIQMASLDELRRSGMPYPRAIPILLSWLARIDNEEVKEAVVRTLSVPWAKGSARALIDEFDRTDSNSFSLRWAIGNAIEVLADASVADDIVRIISDRRNGVARQMFVLALAKVDHSRQVAVLRDLLSDDEVLGHAIQALGKLRAAEARADIEPFQTHKKAWIRKEAKRALAKMRTRS